MINVQLGLKIDEGACRSVSNAVGRWKELLGEDEMDRMELIRQQQGEGLIRGGGWCQIGQQEGKQKILRRKVLRLKGKQKASGGGCCQHKFNQKVVGFKYDQEVEARALEQQMFSQERAGP